MSNVAVRSVSLDLDRELPREEQRAVEEMVRSIAESVIALRSDRREESRQRLVELFAGDDAKLSPVDVQSARLEADALAALASGTQWLTAAEVGALARLGQANPFGTVGRWKRNGQIFAIRRDGRDHFPRYAFGGDYRPLPAMASVLTELSRHGPEWIAGWFESTSGFLGGARPRELIATEPERVIAAARDTVQAEEFAG